VSLSHYGFSIFGQTLTKYEQFAASDLSDISANQVVKLLHFDANSFISSFPRL